jgi:hypothetical protein
MIGKIDKPMIAPRGPADVPPLRRSLLRATSQPPCSADYGLRVAARLAALRDGLACARSFCYPPFLFNPLLAAGLKRNFVPGRTPNVVKGDYPRVSC